MSTSLEPSSKANGESSSRDSLGQGKSGLVGDLDELIESPRFITVEVPGGRLVRLRSINAAELVKLKKVPAEDQAAMAITMCMVDGNGHRLLTANQVDEVKEMDSRVFDALEVAINCLILNQTPLGEMIKNFD